MAAMVAFARASFVSLALVLSATMVCVAADTQSDVATIGRGRSTADTVCWACHVVGADQVFSPILREPAPDFRTIAQRRDVTKEFPQRLPPQHASYRG